MVLAVVAAGDHVATVPTVPVVVENAAMVRTVRGVEAQAPELTVDLLHFEKTGKHLFFVPGIPNWIVVNRNSAILLFNCDGQRTEDEILDSVGLQGDLRRDAHTLFNEARNRGILKGAPPGCTQQSAATCACTPGMGGQNGLLRSVYLKLTDECNLRCKYCYAGSGKPSDILTLDVLRRILKEVAEISKSVEFVLSGGEPLLHPQAVDFAEEAVASGNAVQLLTNGALITTDAIARRISATTNLVKISLDGSTEAVHSISRGKGNFDQVTKAVDLLAKHGARQNGLR